MNVIIVLYVKFSIYEILTIYRKPKFSKHDSEQLIVDQLKLVTDPED